METNNFSDLFFLKTHLTVQIAAEVSVYNPQYLRRLLRAGRLEGGKIGQVWLIRKTSFYEYLKQMKATDDRRFGPNRA